MVRFQRALVGSSSVLHGVRASVTTGVLGLFVGLLTLPLIFATVGAERYGVWLVLFSITQVLLVSDLGIGSAATHFLSRCRGGDVLLPEAAIVLTAVVWGLASSFFSLALYFVFAVTYISSLDGQASLDESSAVRLMWVGACLVMGMAFRPFGSIGLGLGLLVVDRRLQALGLLLRVFGTLAGCLVFDSIVIVAASEALGSLLGVLIMIPIVLAKTGVSARVSWRSCPGVFRIMFRFGWNAFLVNALGVAITQLGTLLVAVLAGPVQVAYFGAASRVASAVRTTVGWAVEPLRPAMSRRFADRSIDRASLLVGVVFTTGAVSSLLVGGLMIAANPLVRVWLGSGAVEAGAATVLQVLLIGLLLNSFHIPLIPLLDGAGYPGAFLWLHFLWLCAAFGGALAGNMAAGFIGVAVGLSLPIVLLEPFYLLRASRVLGVRYSALMLRAVCPVGLAFLAGSAAALAAILVHDVYGRSVLGAMLYCTGWFGFLALWRRRLPLSAVRGALSMDL